MPSRVIKGEIVRSDSLSRVSIEADLTFRNLLLLVDDFGRFDARPMVLAADLFPTRRIDPEQVIAWLRELEREGCIVFYEVDGRPYLHLPNWERHRANGRRAATSKYPEPKKNPNPPGGTGALPRKSAEIPGNPPEGRGTRDEGRVAGGEGRGTRDEEGATSAAPEAAATPPAAVDLPLDDPLRPQRVAIPLAPMGDVRLLRQLKLHVASDEAIAAIQALIISPEAQPSAFEVACWCALMRPRIEAHARAKRKPKLTPASLSRHFTQWFLGAHKRRTLRDEIREAVREVDLARVALATARGAPAANAESPPDPPDFTEAFATL